jgi:hypothetical protein
LTSNFFYAGHIYVTFIGGLHTFGGTFLLPHNIDKKGLHAILVELFHMESFILFAQLCSLFYVVYQGITTYDYVVAMRAMSEAAPEDEEGANIIYSPSNSATTGFSVGSSLGLHHKGAWCTPPRIFIDHVSSPCFKKQVYCFQNLVN